MNSHSLNVVATIIIKFEFILLLFCFLFIFLSYLSCNNIDLCFDKQQQQQPKWNSDQTPIVCICCGGICFDGGNKQRNSKEEKDDCEWLQKKIVQITQLYNVFDQHKNYLNKHTKFFLPLFWILRKNSNNHSKKKKTNNLQILSNTKYLKMFQSLSFLL